IHAGGANTSTILDPYGNFPSQVGITTNFCASPAAGTNAFQRPDGKYVVLCGGAAATAVYDPTAGSWATGPVPSGTFGPGAHAIQRDNGTFLVLRGNNTTDHWIYNPNTS